MIHNEYDHGYADVVIGLQYGDEGKAKIVDRLAGEYDIIARFNGGANAGHSVESDDGRTLALNQVPSGVFYPEKTLYIGSGCAVNVQKLQEEIRKIALERISLDGRLHISPYATVIQLHHTLLDSQMGAGIGTTGNGIGPAYADRASRMDGQRLLSLKVGDLLDEDFAINVMEENLRHTLEDAERIYGENIAFMRNVAIEEIREHIRNIQPFIEKDVQFLVKHVRNGARVLFEGAQAFMLDVNKGTVPYVTSSSTEAAAAFVGGDLPVQYHRKTIGVAKAIMTRVGAGPFVSEWGGKESEEYTLQDGGNAHTKDKEKELYGNPEQLLQSDDTFEIGVALRMLGNEYGVVTKRPRRMGALDLVQLSHAIRLNGVDELHLTKADLLRDFTRTKMGKIPLIASYFVDDDMYPSEIDYVPSQERLHRKVTPVVHMMDGFTEDISEVTSYEDLPDTLQTLIQRIEEDVGCPIAGIGTGPQRNQLLMREVSSKRMC